MEEKVVFSFMFLCHDEEGNEIKTVCNLRSSICPPFSHEEEGFKEVVEEIVKRWNYYEEAKKNQGV